MKYKVIEAGSSGYLSLVVNTLLADGWTPQGGVCFISNGKCAQALVHHGTPCEKPTVEEELDTDEVTTEDTTEATVRYSCMNNNCAAPAAYCRHTQFAGDHYFCEVCGPLEEDFDSQGDSYGFWADVPQRRMT
jgi:hypothetical protein